jgi:hypothetical protein
MKALTATLAAIGMLAAVGCQKSSTQPPEPPAGSKVNVVGGMKNQIFEASSARHIVLTKGTTSTPITDQDGTVRGVSVAKDNDTGLPVACECPGGCSPGDGSGGPIVIGCVTVSGPNDVGCEGSCTAPNKSCMGCSFTYPQPEPGSPRAAWVKRTDAVFSQNP